MLKNSLRTLAALSLTLTIPAFECAATDAAKVYGDLRVNGIVFNNDGSSMQTKASPWSFSGFDIFYNVIGGKVGIGTPSPAVPLDVTGNARVTGTLTSGDITTTGNITIPATGIIRQDTNTLIISNEDRSNFFSGPIAGNLTMSGSFNTASGPYALSRNTTGSYNTAHGTGALLNNSTGSNNAACGSYALYGNTTGNYNTASGNGALSYSSTGSYNTAVGGDSLIENDTGSNNTAVGVFSLNKNVRTSKNTAVGSWALYYNSDPTGSPLDTLNTALGYEALYFNSPTLITNGIYNTATGARALRSNTTGYHNTANGFDALYSNTTGYKNTAVGYQALYSNKPTLASNGIQNTATGSQSLRSNTTGNNNTAHGFYALYSNTTGTDNTAIGYFSGYSQTTGSNNIYIGALVDAVAGESDVIRIGAGSTQAYVAGIYETTSASGAAVYVNSDGRLGRLTSSRRYKEDISDMGNKTDGLMSLRPVSFYYKPEFSSGQRILQYGLIAEEVEQVYPGLVHYNEIGEPDSVYYQHLNSMLLNEVQKQHRTISTLEERLARLEALLLAK